MKKDPTALPIIYGIILVILAILIFSILGLNFLDIKTVLFVFIFAFTFYILLTSKY
jgi:hypothetical protein